MVSFLPSSAVLLLESFPVAGVVADAAGVVVVVTEAPGVVVVVASAAGVVVVPPATAPTAGSPDSSVAKTVLVIPPKRAEISAAVIATVNVSAANFALLNFLLTFRFPHVFFIFIPSFIFNLHVNIYCTFMILCPRPLLTPVVCLLFLKSFHP